MILNMLIATSVGFIVWMCGFIYSNLPRTIYIVISIFIPFVIGVLYSIYIGGGKLRIAFYALITIITHHLLVLLRVAVAFREDQDRVIYIIGTLKAFAYLVPLEVCAVVLGCFIVFKIRAENKGLRH
jgi:hypothetical protein